MFEPAAIDTTDKATRYRDLDQQLTALLAGERDLIANAANMSSLLFHALPEVNWVGIYLLKDQQLVLGPFQGKPACTRIAIGKGVCGTAASRRASVIVEDVARFPGHIACDSASRSELVVPLIDNDGLLGVLDLDSPHLARFDERDRLGCERLAAILVRASSYDTIPD